MVPQSLPVRDPFRINNLPSLPAIKEFNKLLIHGTRFRMREATVFVKDGGMGPLLEFAETADQAAGTVFALIAVDQDRMVPAVEEDCECGADLVVWDLNKGLLVSGNSKLKEGDLVLLQELHVLIRVVLENECQDTLETELLQKGKVLLLGETTAIDPGRDHVEVVRRAEVLRVG